jgi:riboflavin biosynthesis pyrimidine reductase
MGGMTGVPGRFRVRAGLVDEIRLRLVPVLFGAGTRLFDDLGTKQIELESTEVVASPAVTHLRFRVATGELLPG